MASTAASRALERVTCERNKSLSSVSENLAAFAPARDADVKLFLIDGGQRTRRGDHQTSSTVLPWAACDVTA
jgi:hypothetical protein